jgi:hypothetical protein
MLPSCRARAPLGSLVGSLLLATAVLAGCRTTEDMQRDYAKKITPHGVEATSGRTPWVPSTSDLRTG